MPQNLQKHLSCYKINITLLMKALIIDYNLYLLLFLIFIDLIKKCTTNILLSPCCSEYCLFVCKLQIKKVMLCELSISKSQI